MAGRSIFLTGGTGYMGSRLIPRLLARGHSVIACVRRGSEGKVPSGASVVTGDPLDAGSMRASLGACDTWVQLIGTPHPAPWKADQFRAVDLRAARAMAEALPGSPIKHSVYLSVAQPAPMMKAFIAVRAEAESLLRATGIPCTFLRPWYVLGPGHRWPYALIPVYKILEWVPSTRAGALKFGLVTIGQMLRALVHAVENPPTESPRILDVPALRRTP